jgi:tetratricopeptide (TPR) repeat protein
MFLTKKSFIKILIIAICFFAIGCFFIGLDLVFMSIGVSDGLTLKLGLIECLLALLMVAGGMYGEGKAKLIQLGNKLVRIELKPMEFIKHYEQLQNSQNLIIKKPSIEVLQLVAVAYDLMGEKEKALAAFEEMIEVADGKKKVFAKLLKVSFLYGDNKVEEAEALFVDLKKQKLDLMSQGLADAILQDGRAVAMGDYRTAEAYQLNLLQRQFPKLDNLGTLVTHYSLGEIYEKLEEKDKAITYYSYCAEHGGETVLKKSAIEKLEAVI